MMTATDFVPEVIFKSPERETAFQARLKRTMDNAIAVGVIKGLLMTNRVLKHRLRVLENQQADTAEIDRLKRDVDHWRDAAHERATENSQLREAARKARNRVAIIRYRERKRSSYQPRVLRVRAVG